MGFRERFETTFEAANCVRCRDRGVKALMRETLNDRQGVLHPVVELAEEQLLVPLEALALGDVMSLSKIPATPPSWKTGW